MYSILILFGGGFLLTAGDIVFKTWLKNQSVGFYYTGLALYIMGLMCLIESFKYQNIAVASAILVIGNLLILNVASWWIFKEPLSPLGMLGMVLALGSILCLKRA